LALFYEINFLKLGFWQQNQERFWGDRCSWVKNVGGRVNLEWLGKIGRKNVVKNCKKFVKMSKNE